MGGRRTIRVAGSDVKLGAGGTFIGTFIAPDAHIDMYEDAMLEGTLYGGKVHIKKGARVMYERALDLFIKLFIQ